MFVSSCEQDFYDVKGLLLGFDGGFALIAERYYAGEQLCEGDVMRVFGSL